MVKSITENKRTELIGKEVWFRTSYKDFNTGILQQVEGMGHAMIRVASDEPCLTKNIHVHVNDIFETKEDLIAANYERFRSKVGVYKQDIHTIEDLLKFCYIHTDYAAKSTMREMARELMDIEIDPDTTEIEKQLI